VRLVFSAPLSDNELALYEHMGNPMAQGVPIMYGVCDGGPWHAKHLAHHEPVYIGPMETHSKKIVVAVQPGTKGFMYGEYHFADGKWSWVPPGALTKAG
jgi:hypothetical protein